MISLTLALIIGVALLSVIAWFKWQANRAARKIAEMEQQNQQLQTEKAVAQTQVKHFEVRKTNEENARNADRTAVLDRLQQSDDLRD